MKLKYIHLVLFSFTFVDAKPAVSQEFLKYWKSGLAEISSYEIIEERYGELRKAQGVLIFVYEETNSDTRIKVESDKTPLMKQIPVLKLNNILKFNTGIYDYSVMTSVFAALSGATVKRVFEPQKISLSAQEWCGSVYHQLLPLEKGLVSEIHSYFESEGDSKTLLPYPPGEIFYEDELPILLRELDGNFLQIGETKKVKMVPSLWERRKRHDPLTFGTATVNKVGLEVIDFQGKKTNAVHWVLNFRETKTDFWIENSFPKKLLVWKNSRGEKAELIKSIRNSYWENHRNQNLPLRKELQLNYGVRDGN